MHEDKNTRETAFKQHAKFVSICLYYQHVSISIIGIETYDVDVAIAINQGLIMYNKCLYGLRLVMTNRMSGMMINCCTARPSVTANTSIPKSRNDDSMSSIPATATSIKLITPNGVVLKYEYIKFGFCCVL